MTTMDLDSIIKTYSDSSMAIEKESQKTLEEAKAQMIEKAQENADLFPEEIADPSYQRETSSVEKSAEVSPTQEIKFEIPTQFIEEEILPIGAESEAAEAAESAVELTAEAEIESEADAPELEADPSLQDQILMKEIASIPDKLAFKIGEVAEIVDVKQYVLRYWESEFEALRPKKSRQNQRMYTRKDIENILLIKKLLYRDKFSIEGARRALKSLKQQVKETKQWDQVLDRYESAIENVQDLLSEIRRVKDLF